MSGHTATPDALRKLRVALEPVNVEVLARERLANNGRNPANNNAGIRTGSDLHLCEMLIGQLDQARAAFTELASVPALADSHADLVRALKGSNAMLQLLRSMIDASAPISSIDEQVKINSAALAKLHPAKGEG